MAKNKEGEGRMMKEGMGVHVFISLHVFLMYE